MHKYFCSANIIDNLGSIYGGSVISSVFSKNIPHTLIIRRRAWIFQRQQSATMKRGLKSNYISTCLLVAGWVPGSEA
jgi:hypothetical protein